MTDDLTGLSRALRRARGGALLMLAAGVAVGSSAAAYIAWLSSLMETHAQMMFTNVSAMAVGAIPLIVGLTIAIAGGARLRAIRRVTDRPGDVVATDLAMRRGQPAMRFQLRNGGAVVIATGDADRDAIALAVRHGTLGARLPAARVVV